MMHLNAFIIFKEIKLVRLVCTLKELKKEFAFIIIHGFLLLIKRIEFDHKQRLPNNK